MYNVQWIIIYISDKYRAKLLMNSAENIFKWTSMWVEIKYNMQHETLSNDLAPWHVSRCVRYGSCRIFSFLSVAPKKNQKKTRGRGREKGEREDERRAGLEHERARETEGKWRAYYSERNIHAESASRSARPSADWRWMKTRSAR